MNQISTAFEGEIPLTWRSFSQNLRVVVKELESEDRFRILQAELDSLLEEKEQYVEYSPDDARALLKRAHFRALEMHYLSLVMEHFYKENEKPDLQEKWSLRKEESDEIYREISEELTISKNNKPSEERMEAR